MHVFAPPMSSFFKRMQLTSRARFAGSAEALILCAERPACDERTVKCDMLGKAATEPMSHGATESPKNAATAAEAQPQSHSHQAITQKPCGPQSRSLTVTAAQQPYLRPRSRNSRGTGPSHGGTVTAPQPQCHRSRAKAPELSVQSVTVIHRTIAEP